MYGAQPMYGGNPGFYQSPYTAQPYLDRLAQMQQTQQGSRDGLIRVTGIEGAKAYQMPPNSRVALFDDTDDVVIIKVTDGAGFPSYRRARLGWIDDQPAQQAATQAQEYVTRAEFDELKEMIINGKQSVRARARTESPAPADGE